EKIDLKQIHPLIAGDLPQAQTTFEGLINNTVFRLLLLLPFVGLLVFEVLRKRKQARSNNLGAYKWKAANKVALKRLKQAKLHLAKHQKDPFYEEIAKALWLYVSDKTTLPLAELSKEKGLEALQ